MALLFGIFFCLVRELFCVCVCVCLCVRTNVCMYVCTSNLPANERKYGIYIPLCRTMTLMIIIMLHMIDAVQGIQGDPRVP